MSKKKQAYVECIAIVSAKCSIQDHEQVERVEHKQEAYIRKYAKTKNIKIVAVFYGSGMGWYEINHKFNQSVELIRRGKVQGIITVNMRMISQNLEDAYRKVGKVRSAGGELITVDEGTLKLNIWRNDENERYE